MKRNITTSGPPLPPTINAWIHDGVGNRPKVSMSDSVFISNHLPERRAIAESGHDVSHPRSDRGGLMENK